MDGKILITGGAGFIGAQVNQDLANRGYKTLVLDNLSSGSRQAVLQGTFVEGDLSDSQFLDQIFSGENISSVMHFAANTDVGESVADPGKYYVNNVCNTLNLLNAMRKSGIKVLIFSSSAAVYGIPEKETLGENDPCHPINPYGESKLMAEKILEDFSRAYGMRACSLRYFNAAGGDPQGKIKNYKTHESNLIPVVLNCIKKGSAITVNGNDYPTRDGTCIRDYIHVADLSEAHIQALEKLQTQSLAPCYNLGNERGFSVLEVIDAAQEITGQKLPLIFGKRRPGDPPVLLADAGKARRELGWSPRYNLKSIIEDAWKAK